MNNYHAIIKALFDYAKDWYEDRNCDIDNEGFLDVLDGYLVINDQQKELLKDIINGK